ncbi:MAG: hypothetical protein ABGX36_06445 [Cycloclasticus sp.]
MTDYKDKYLRAVKALDEVEQEEIENIQALSAILWELKGQHKMVDKAISALPKKLSINELPPIKELVRLKNLIVSYFNQTDDVGATPSV